MPEPAQRFLPSSPCAPLLGLALLMGASSCALQHALLLREGERNTPATLHVGDPAPPLQVSEWVRGQPLAELEPGRIYVLDFWASWCGCCLASMGRSSALQEKYGQDVTLIAISAADTSNPRRAILDTVEQRAGDFRLHVAIDARDRTTAAYLRASRVIGIPTAFVVDRQGRVAWIGHPIDLDPVLDAIVHGTWDLAAETQRSRKAADERWRARPLVDELLAAQREHADARELELLGELCTFDPENIPYAPLQPFAARRTTLLVQAGRLQEAASCAAQAAESPHLCASPMALVELAQAVEPADASLCASLVARCRKLIESGPEPGKPADAWDELLAEDRRALQAAVRARLAALP